RVGIVAAGQPEHAGLVEQRAADALLERLPRLERAQRPARVELVATVAHADHARLAAGAGAAMARAVGVEQQHLVPGAQQLVRAPGAEAAGADDDEIEAPGSHAEVS